MYTLGLPQEYYSSENGLEYYGQISFLKAGILKTDLVYTVSPKYAEEVATPLFGAGLDGLIRRASSEKRFYGILNGIDNSKWDPSVLRDEAVKFTFDTNDLSGKSQGKLALQADWKLPVDVTIPIFVMSSRVAEQKGYEYLPLAIERFLEKSKAQFIIIGDGDATYTDKLQALQLRFPEKVRFQAFSESAEKVLKAYGDFFVNAAWFEPSGLNQMFALKNGTIPILSRVGGLSNSVQDGISGFLFDIRWKDDNSGYDVKATATSLEDAFERALKVYEIQPETIKQMRIAGMNIDNSWNSRVNNEFTSLFQNRLSIPLKKPAKTCQETLQAAQ
jgi:starch synthase